MTQPQKIEEAFAPLTERIIKFRNRFYLYYEESEDELDVIDKITEITKQIMIFNASERYREAKIYESMVRSIIADLKMFQYAIDALFSSESYDNWQRELEIYLANLITIQELSTSIPYVKEAELSANKAPFIKLPENFKTPDIQNVFKPVLNKDTGALFLNYLRMLNVTPNYVDTDLSLLATLVFGVSNNTVRTQLGSISNLRKNKEDLTNLKEILFKIIKQIEEDELKIKS